MRYEYVASCKSDNDQFIIYRDSVTKKFYAVESNYEIEDPDLDYIIDYSFNTQEDESLKSNEITNKNMIKALEEVYQIGKHNYIKNKIEARNERIKEEKKIYRRNIILLIHLVTSLLIARPHVSMAVQEFRNNHHLKQIEASLDNDNQFTVYYSFCESLIINKTLSDDLLKTLFKDFNRLVFSDTPIFENNADAINKRLREYDFTNLNETNYESALEYIIFGRKTAVSKCATLSLISYANNCENDVSMLFGELTLPFCDKDILETIITKNDKAYIKEVSEYYSVSEDKVETALNLLKHYAESTDWTEKIELKAAYQKIIHDILTSYYVDRGILTEFDHLVLASEIYDGTQNVYNNIFSDYITVSHSSREYPLYKRYFSKELSKKEVSMNIYKDKLTTLIEEKGDNLDYNDPDCRFMLYLYTLCINDSIISQNKDLLSSETAEDIAEIIINDVFDNEGSTRINKEFLYTYFTCGKININDLRNYLQLDERDGLSVSLYVDFLNCLKKEDYISETEYSGIVDKVISNLKLINYRLVGTMEESLNSGESMFEEFKLLPQIQEYKEESVKKLVVEQKYPQKEEEE